MEGKQRWPEEKTSDSSTWKKENYQESKVIKSRDNLEKVKKMLFLE